MFKNDLFLYISIKFIYIYIIIILIYQFGKREQCIFSFDELNDDEVIEIKNQYNEIKNDILSIAQVFSKNKEEEIAITLKNALIIPDNDSIYAGEFRDKYTEKWYKSPVVINWGFKNKENFQT